MSKLPLLSWREVVKTLAKAGFQIARQRGSHLILVKNDRIVPFPKHEQIKKGLLMTIIEESGLTNKSFKINRISKHFVPLLCKYSYP